MKLLDVEPIIGNKGRPWFPVFQVSIDRGAALQWFQAKPHVDWIDGLGNADYWAAEFDCGLRLAFEFIHYCSYGIVLATEPVSQHVGRHLKHWHAALVECPPNAFERERVHMIAHFADQIPGLLRLQSFQVWRQGDDGNQVKVGISTSQQDAECWLCELESHFHKQTYWITCDESA